MVGQNVETRSCGIHGTSNRKQWRETTLLHQPKIKENTTCITSHWPWNYNCNCSILESRWRSRFFQLLARLTKKNIRQDWQRSRFGKVCQNRARFNLALSRQGISLSCQTIMILINHTSNWKILLMDLAKYPGSSDCLQHFALSLKWWVLQILERSCKD